MANDPRNYQISDRILFGIDQFIKSVTQTVNKNSEKSTVFSNSRPNPANKINEQNLTNTEKKLSASLMRVNHCGEICAQALYIGQHFTSRDPKISNSLQQAANEEIDHLAWCAQRLYELDSRPSYLNPIWFSSSLMLGVIAGLCGDQYSLGFLAETEHQVVNHLENHLEKLPDNDHKSRAILIQMQQEEAEHAHSAEIKGAAQLPAGVKWLMQRLSKVMTTVAYYV